VPDDNKCTVQASNLSSSLSQSYRSCALDHILLNEVAGAAFCLTTDDAIADSGATHFFVMDGTPVINKQVTMRPLKVSLTASGQVVSTHMCDIHIDGLPFVLMGHIIPDLSIASLFGIRVLTEAGCEVTFTDKECIVHYKSNIILRGKKDAATDLWTLPLGTPDMTTQHVTSILPLAAPIIANAHAHLTVSALHINLCVAHRFQLY
jgi:hypothetical protein